MLRIRGRQFFAAPDSLTLFLSLTNTDSRRRFRHGNSCFLAALSAGQSTYMASEATQILWAINSGNRGGASRLLELVYDELRTVAHRTMRPRSPAEPLQPTELVHEVYVRLVDKQTSDWRSRSHFFAVAATAMRHILVDAARARAQLKRGGGAPHFSLDEGLVLSTERDADVLALDEALLVLAHESADRARLVELRFFGGLTMDEIAATTDTSKRSVEREWRITRAWLRRHLTR